MLRAFLTALSGTAVEFFETVAIAYAIVRAGYPREAISATALGQALMFVAAIFLWPVHQVIPVFWFRLLAATLLTWMGAYWTLKSLKRRLSGLRPRWVDDPLGRLHVQPESAQTAFSLLVFLVMLKSSAVEAFEILLVVFPLGAAIGHWWAIVTGTALAIVSVLTAALLLHGQFKRVPEVTLKLATGVVLLAIGVSWLLELLL